MAMLIDTHTHLYFEQFDDDRDEVIQRALEAGVNKIITIGIDVQTSRQCIELAEQYPGVFAAIGVHPNDSTTFNENTLEILKLLAQDSRVVAIGEVGLDYYRDRAPVEAQKVAFRQQIALARELDLPIVIHNREAIADIVEILETEGTDGTTGVFHCFSDDVTWAQRVLNLGFYISFTGNLTFKKSTLPDVARAVPLERLLLETDSPFLSPEPRRGRRNEPAHVVHIAAKIAELKNVDVAEVAEITTANAMRLFGLGNEKMA